ncbi:MAG: type II secretion system GspH family protein [Fimbriimonadaceae bacterium]|nr:type II secretion system GspH family protein [Fimbriimonadaceae bacterium]
MRQAGFSQIEVLTAVGIMALLSAIAVPSVRQSWERQRAAVMKERLAAVRAAVQTYYRDTGCFPTALEDLANPGALPYCFRLESGTVNYGATPRRSNGPYVYEPILAPYGNQGNLVDWNWIYDTESTSASGFGKISAPATGNDPDGVSYASY